VEAADWGKSLGGLEVKGFRGLEVDRFRGLGRFNWSDPPLRSATLPMLWCFEIFLSKRKTGIPIT
jgi:hypothetical protein